MTSFSSKGSETLYFECKNASYENYFYADHTCTCQVVLASPLPAQEQNGMSEHRLLFAWPAGNSGAVVFFKSSDRQHHGQLVKMRRNTAGHALSVAQHDSAGSGAAVSCLLEIVEPAFIDLAILGSIRTIRDYTEGNSLLNPIVQKQICVEASSAAQDGVSISRLWFDQKTLTRLTFEPIRSVSGSKGIVSVAKPGPAPVIHFTPGTYLCKAHMTFPEIVCLPATNLLRTSAHHLISSSPNAVEPLSFLCTSDKILAGAWRFLTYFGRDSMISLLLLNPILSTGEQGPIENGLRAVLERIDHRTGSVCHEETIGDYVAAQAALKGGMAYEPEYDYKMIDTDFFLPILMKQYFIDDQSCRSRLSPFLKTRASLIPSNLDLTYGDLFMRTCQKIILAAEPFVREQGKDRFKSLIALKSDQPVGQWRDSNDGLGGGRYPYDVNTALMPAALRAISSLADAGVFQLQPGWSKLTADLANVWELAPLDYFSVNLALDEAQRRLDDYRSGPYYSGPSEPIRLKAQGLQGELAFQALALRENGSQVEIMHTDDCFRLFFLPQLICSANENTRIKHLEVLDHFTALLLRTFPTGLCTSVGVLIANPAFSADAGHHQAFSRGAYHGTVVWSWNSLAMIAKGLELQLSTALAAQNDIHDLLNHNTAHSHFFHQVLAQTKQAYGRVWDIIDANREHLSSEVWSWKWNEEAAKYGGDGFQYIPLSHLPTPAGDTQTEGNIRQLWSLTFLALKRHSNLEQ